MKRKPFSARSSGRFRQRAKRRLETKQREKERLEAERLKKVHLEAEQLEKELEAEELEKETLEAEQRMSRYRSPGGTPPRIETFLPIT